MKLLILKTTNPYYNLAVEEYFFEKSKDTVFILWQNEPSVVIGKNQNVNAELNFEFIKENNIHIVRRITGGGAVYHDLGNLNYSFISDAKSDGIDFTYFTKPIVDALNTLGVGAVLTGRNDIEVDGKKISGNAQYTKNGRTLHHGTLLFNTELDVLSKALYVDKEKIKAKAIKSTKARVTNLKDLIPISNIETFIEYLYNTIIDKYSPEIINPPTGEYINKLRERNSSKEWIFPSNKFLSSYTAKRKRKYPFGLIEANISFDGEIITDISIFGDFFGNTEIEELCEKVKGKKISELKETDVHSYISGMTDSQFIDFLSE